MTKRLDEVKAKLLNTASVEKGRQFFVLASEKPVINHSEVLASFKCKQCSTQFATLAGSNPFCVTCGNDEVDEYEDDMEIEELDAESEEMASVECLSCGTHSILTVATAKLFGSKVHCVTCSDPIGYQIADYDEDSVEDFEVEDVLDDEGLGDESVEELDLTETDELPVEVESEDVSSEAPADVELPGDESATDTVSEDAVSEEVEGVKEEIEEMKDDEGVNKDDLQDLSEEVEEVEDAVDADETSADSMESSDDEEDLDDMEDYEEEEMANLIKGDATFTHVGETLVASVNNVPVATLTKANAGEYANMFFGREFVSAIKHTVKTNGLKPALAHFKFEMAKVSIPMKAIVAKRVQAGVEKHNAQLASKLDELAQDMEQAQSIAMAALNKGFFKGKDNALKTAFVDEMTVAGVRNAASVVDRVFAHFSQPYSKQVIALAKDLANKPTELLNEIAASVRDANFQPVTLNTETAELESRLEGAGVKPSAKANMQTAATVQTASVKETFAQIRAARGGRLY